MTLFEELNFLWSFSMLSAMSFRSLIERFASSRVYSATEKSCENVLSFGVAPMARRVRFVDVVRRFVFLHSYL